MANQPGSKSAKAGKVAAVRNSYTLVINRGAEHAVHVGDRFLIYSMGTEIQDPDTGESLGPLEIVKGTGTVTHVQPKMATLSSDMKAPAGRSVRKAGRGGLVFSSILGEPEVEEILPPKPVAFDDPQVGDFAKPV